jgi:alpha-1,3-rhamnosyltransferase
MSLDNLPLVSVLIPSYNHEKYVGEAILSVVNQTYKNIELIVIDDGSTDSSPKIISKLQETYKFIYIQRENKGLIKTLEELRKIARGKYISLFSSDDKYALEKIEKLVKFMENNYNNGMVYSKIITIDNLSNVGNQISEHYKSGNIFDDLVKGEFFINGLTALIKKEVYDQFYYDSSIYIDDLQIWLKIAEKYEIGFVDEYLAYYRKHDNHMSGNLLKMQESEEQIINQYKHKDCYDEAINEWNLRWFHNTSLCHKMVAFNKYLPRVLRLKNLFRLKVYKALIRFLIPCKWQGRG